MQTLSFVPNVIDAGTESKIALYLNHLLYKPVPKSHLSGTEHSPPPPPSPPDQELLVLREFELVPHLFRLFISEAYFGKLKVKSIAMVNLE